MTDVADTASPNLTNNSEVEFDLEAWQQLFANNTVYLLAAQISIQILDSFYLVL